MPRITRRALLGSAAAAPFGSSALSGCTASGRLPNIVYIYSDQHRAPFLGSYGHPTVLTTHIDALAAEGVVFENCFTNSPICRPARATMMTGQLPHVHGSWSNSAPYADRTQESHVRRIRDAGWRTALFGKAHLDRTVDDPRRDDLAQRLVDWGFMDFVELLSQPNTAEFVNAYSEWLRENTPPGERTLDARYRQYIDEWKYADNNPAPDEAPYNIPTERHLDVFCADNAVDWLRQQTGDTPFYVQVNFPGPHSPFDSPTEYRALYDLGEIGLPILGAPENAGALVAYLHQSKPELQARTADEYRMVLLSYFAKISLIDAQVGRVVAAIEDAGLSDDTWIIYGSDHGELVGDHELWGKVAMYEGSLRIPLVVRPPGGTSPWRTTANVDQRDVTQTILDICGLSGPGGGISQLGRILAGPGLPDTDVGREHIVALIEGHFVSGLRTAMSRSDRYKLVVDLDSRRNDVLYDLESDPDEQTNLVGDPSLQGVITELSDALDAEMTAAAE